MRAKSALIPIDEELLDGVKDPSFPLDLHLCYHLETHRAITPLSYLSSYAESLLAEDWTTLLNLSL